MHSDTETDSWASRGEAGTQQLRRFSQAVEQDSRVASPSLPPLASLLDPKALSTPMLTHSVAAAARDHKLVPLRQDRDAPVTHPCLNDAAAPSLATLNRDFDSLALQFAGHNKTIAGTPLDLAALRSHGSSRQASAPGVSRALPQRQRSQSQTPVARLYGSATTVDRTSDGPPFVLRSCEHSITSAKAGSTSAAPKPASKSPTQPPIENGGDDASKTPSKGVLPGKVQIAEVTEVAVPNGMTSLPGASSQSGAPFLSPVQHVPKAKLKTADAAGDRVLDGSPLASPTESAAPVQSEISPTGVTSRRPSSAARVKGRDGRILVVVRKRPLVPGEPGTDCVEVNGPHVRIAVTKQRVDLSSYEEVSDYVFDHAFGASATNEEVYTTAVRALLTVSLEGGSASCFAYGQTGSGKTYTTMGVDTAKGLYIQAAADLFQRLRPTQQLQVAFFEIYCNSLYDLLNRRHPIVLREDAQHRVNICGVTWWTVTGIREMWQQVKTGMEQRRTGTTAANEHSSRSHAVLIIHITDRENPNFLGTVNFVDLAGSERAADTIAKDRLTRLEGAEINKSLLALKECIRALDEKRKHVPFRGSRLTEVLRDSFTGHSKTVMIAAVSPSSVNHEHTNNTLRYAFRVKGLSVPSVEPSKARNAPRPYRPASRGRSGPPALRDNTSEVLAIGARLGAGASPQPEEPTIDVCGSRKPQYPQRRRSSQKKDRRGQQSEATSVEDTVMGVPSEVAEVAGPGLRVAQRARVRNASRDSCGPQHLPSMGKQQDLFSLLPDTSALYQQRRASPEFTSEGIPRHRLSVLSASDVSNSFLASVKDTRRPTHAMALPGIQGVRGGVCAAEVEALERHLTRKIMTQLQHDLGKQLEEVLVVKDTAIASLQMENARLRRALEKERQAGRRSESFPAEEGADGRATSVFLPLPYPSSPSILLEQYSTGASSSTSAEEAPIRVVP